MKTTYERFESKVIPEPNTGCYLWTGATVCGYGQMYTPHGIVYAHRFSFEKHNGHLIPPGLMVLHRCDTPACVNPDHLFLGTNEDNRTDSVSKRRHAHGESHGHARLNRAKAGLIRAGLAAGRNIRALACEFGVDPKTVRDIRNGKTWRLA